MRIPQIDWQVSQFSKIRIDQAYAIKLIVLAKSCVEFVCGSLLIELLSFTLAQTIDKNLNRTC